MKHLFLVAGHGKSWTGREDVGAVANNTTERKEVKEISIDILRILGRSNINFEVHLIGIYSDLSLKEKIDKINLICRNKKIKKEDSILISLHTNSFSDPNAHGVETWYKNNSRESRNLALLINSNLAIDTGFRNRGIKPDSDNRHGRLAILSDVIPNACLVECGFLSNVAEARILTDPNKDDVFAESIVNSIDKINGFSVEVKPRDNSDPYDLEEDAWYYEDAIYLLNRGILNGYPDKTFRPAKSANRAELAKIVAGIYREIDLLKNQIN